MPTAPPYAEPGSATSLVREAARGDEAAWRELVSRYQSVVWAVARDHRLSAADAADVSQATWLTLAQQLGRLRDPERIAGWLATTARRESLRAIAVRRRELPLAGVVDAEHPGAGPAAVAEDADRDCALWRALGGLPERCRRLLRLIALAPELTYAQAARALGIQAGSVGPIKTRCLAVLRRRLEADGVIERVAR